jgi:hypothetical protein
MRNIKKILSIAILSLSMSTGCAAVMGALPTIIQIVQDAMLILDDIDHAAKPFFERAENKELLDQYNAKMLTAKKTLRVALRATEGGQQLSDEEIDSAFADFREAYKELLSLLRDNNLMTEKGSLKAVNGVTIDVDEPLAIARASE